MPPRTGMGPMIPLQIRPGFRVLGTQCRFETGSKRIALRINLCTGKFAEARIYCAGVAGVLAAKGIRGHSSWRRRPCRNSDEEERHEENRVLDTLDHGNVPCSLDIPGGCVWSKGARGGFCGVSFSQPRGSGGCPSASATPTRARSDRSDAKRQGASGARRGRVPRTSRKGA
jgi:hypothetical protein